MKRSFFAIPLFLISFCFIFSFSVFACTPGINSQCLKLSISPNPAVAGETITLTVSPGTYWDATRGDYYAVIFGNWDGEENKPRSLIPGTFITVLPNGTGTATMDLPSSNENYTVNAVVSMESSSNNFSITESWFSDPLSFSVTTPVITATGSPTESPTNSIISTVVCSDIGEGCDLDEKPLCYPETQQCNPLTHLVEYSSRPSATNMPSDLKGGPYCDNSVGMTSGIRTAIGCIKFSNDNASNDLITIILKIATSIGGGLALALILYGVFIVTTSAGMPDKLKAGSEIITSAIIGLIFILLSIFLVNLIGINILGIPGLS